MITRRSLLALLPAASSLFCLPAWTQSSLFSRKPRLKVAQHQPFVYVGTDTDKPGAKGIYVSRFDPATGHLTQPVLAAPSFRPAFLALNQLGGRCLLYAANEGDTHTSTVSTFLVDPVDGSLRLLGQVSAGGGGPCYISVDATGHAAFVANYSGGTVTSFRVLPDGVLSDSVDRIDFRNEKVFGHHGPVADRQDASHPHSAMVSPQNRFLIVNDLGNDHIAIFPMDSATAKLGTPEIIQTHPGSGPRHLAFHPNIRWAYGIDELSSKIDQYLWNTTHGSKAAEAEALLTDTGHSVSTIDVSFHGTNTAAEVVVEQDGFYVYASNRGENTLVVYKINQIDGSLRFQQRISCGGSTPRHFTLDQTGRWLVCGNQDSASMTVFARDASTGQLSGPVQTLPIVSPMYTLFVSG